MYFKILFVFLLLAVKNSISQKDLRERRPVPFSPDVAQCILKNSRQCMVEFHNDPKKVVELIRQGSYGTDEPFKKFIHCAFYRSGYSYDNGTVIVDRVIKAFPPDSNIGPTVRMCSLMIGKDPVDTTFEYFKCFEANSPVRVALQ